MPGRYAVHSVVVTDRQDCCWSTRTLNIEVVVLGSSGETSCGEKSYPEDEDSATHSYKQGLYNLYSTIFILLIRYDCPGDAVGDYVLVRKNIHGAMHVNHMKVIGVKK